MTADTASAVSERIRFCTVYVVLFVFTKAVKSVYSVLIRIVLYSVLIRIMYCDTLIHRIQNWAGYNRIHCI